jgi:hypothetical protein
VSSVILLKHRIDCSFASSRWLYRIAALVFCRRDNGRNGVLVYWNLNYHCTKNNPTPHQPHYLLLRFCPGSWQFSHRMVHRFRSATLTVIAVKSVIPSWSVAHIATHSCSAAWYFPRTCHDRGRPTYSSQSVFLSRSDHICLRLSELRTLILNNPIPLSSKKSSPCESTSDCSLKEDVRWSTEAHRRSRRDGIGIPELPFSFWRRTKREINFTTDESYVLRTTVEESGFVLLSKGG